MFMDNLLITDFDKTLIKGDSIFALSKIMIDLSLLNKEFWDREFQLDADNHYFSLKKKKVIYDIYFSLSKKEQNQIISSLLASEETNPIWEVIEKVNDFRLEKIMILVTTASFNWLVEPILNKLSFQYDFLHYSTFSEIDDPINSKLHNSGLNKLQTVKNHFKIYGKPKKIIVFSDNFSDLPILLLGQKSYVVKNTINSIDDWSNFFDFETIYH